MRLSLFCLTAALLAVAPAFGARNTGYQPRRKRAELARKPERDLQKKQPGKGKPKSIVLTTGGAPVPVDEDVSMSLNSVREPECPEGKVCDDGGNWKAVVTFIGKRNLGRKVVRDQFSFTLGTLEPHNVTRNGYFIQLSGIEKTLAGKRILTAAVSNTTNRAPASVNHNSTAKNSTLPFSLQSFASTVNLPKKATLPATASKTAIAAVNSANAAAGKTANATAKTANASVQAINKPSPLLAGLQHMQGKDLPTQSNSSKNATAPPAPAKTTSSGKSSAPIFIPSNLPPGIKDVILGRPTNTTTRPNTTTTAPLNSGARNVSATATSTPPASTSNKASTSTSTSTSTPAKPSISTSTSTSSKASAPSLVESVNAAALKNAAKAARNAARGAGKTAQAAGKAVDRTVDKSLEKTASLPSAVKNASVNASAATAAPLKNVTLPAGLGTVSVKDSAAKPVVATSTAPVVKAPGKAAVTPEKTDKAVKTEAPKKAEKTDEKADKPRAVYTVLLLVTPPDELPRRG